MTGRLPPPPVAHADVVIAGIGLGAIAAALAIADRGLSVIMAGPERRIGGQVTSQLTSPLDEHPLIETTGCTARYRAFRDGIRGEYGGVKNPGGGWVSRLCFEPLVGERVLLAMLAPHVESGAVVILTEARLTAVDRESRRVTAIVVDTGSASQRLAGSVVIDATETGDVLAMSGADWIVGSEGRDAFGEPHALPGGAHVGAEQSCTIVAALTRDDAPQPVGVAPPGYARMRDAQPFSFTLSNGEGDAKDYAMYDDEAPPGSFWSYRRVRDPRLVGGRETAIINWHGNDHYGSALTADPAGTDAAARALTAAFVYWLRTEAPRDDGGTGHPELRLAPEVSGTSDGLAETPYVRESRRIRSRHPVTEQDLASVPGLARARQHSDTVGVAWYHADLHPRVGGHASVFAPTAPFQVPLSALVCADTDNLIAGAKNLAATQVAAAAYRVHPGEWAVGEAAGVLAAHAVLRRIDPVDAAKEPRHRLAIQLAALRGGAPIFWATDVNAGHPAFVAGSLLAAHGGLDAERLAVLEVSPDDSVGTDGSAALLAAAVRLSDILGVEHPASGANANASWADAARRLAAPIIAALDAVVPPSPVASTITRPAFDHE